LLADSQTIWAGCCFRRQYLILWFCLFTSK